MIALGIDTSNYTTSAALYDGEKMDSRKTPLPVKEGSVGLRQSDALFHHVTNLPDLLDRLLRDWQGSVSTVGVSARPRNQEGSYMPCFLAGRTVARAIAAATGATYREYSHQEGHIMAALYASGQLCLASQKFIAFHVSGGTTEALLVQPSEKHVFQCDVIAKSLDLKAGQAVDRVGRMLGLPFPAGIHLERLAGQSEKKFSIHPTMKGRDCCLSGIENQCEKMLKNGEPAEDVAKYCISFICAVVDEMTRQVRKDFGRLPLVYAGGVMSNSLIRKQITEKYGGYFASPEFSSDNAAGIAVMTLGWYDG